jgi:hypothetical protein
VLKTVYVMVKLLLVWIFLDSVLVVFLIDISPLMEMTEKPSSTVSNNVTMNVKNVYLMRKEPVLNV